MALERTQLKSLSINYLFNIYSLIHTKAKQNRITTNFTVFKIMREHVPNREPNHIPHCYSYQFPMICTALYKLILHQAEMNIILSVHISYFHYTVILFQFTIIVAKPSKFPHRAPPITKRFVHYTHLKYDCEWRTIFSDKPSREIWVHLAKIAFKCLELRLTFIVYGCAFQEVSGARGRHEGQVNVPPRALRRGRAAQAREGLHSCHVTFYQMFLTHIIIRIAYTMPQEMFILTFRLHIVLRNWIFILPFLCACSLPPLTEYSTQQVMNDTFLIDFGIRVSSS